VKFLEITEIFEEQKNVFKKNYFLYN